MLSVKMGNIRKSFGSKVALDDVSFQVEAGHIHCLLGENGAGKSTLMNVLFGLHTPEAGSIEINGETIVSMNSSKASALGIGMVHQHFMLIDDLTVLENIILGVEPGSGMRIDYATAREKIRALSEKYGLQLALDKKIRQLTVGEMQRVEIMKTLYRGAEIIIMDEPTAVLTPLEVEHLLEILREMRAHGKTIIFITHKLNETMAVSDEVTVLRNGRSVFHAVTEDTTPNRLARQMVGDELPAVLGAERRKPAEHTVLELNGIRLMPSADDVIDLSIREGEILGVAGVAGNGQQELEQIIIGTTPVLGGSIRINGEDVTALDVRGRRKRGIGYIPSDRHRYAIVSEMTLEENYLLGHQWEDAYVQHGFINRKHLRGEAERLMAQFDVRSQGRQQKICELSGGNQQKLVLGREVSHDAAFMLASQPTRGLDISATAFIEKTLIDLKNEGKAVLFISTELSELFEVCDRIAVLYKGKIMAVREACDYTNESISLLMAGAEEAGNDKKN